MNKIETPTLDIMIEIQEQSQLCGEFLDWLLRKYTMFDRKQKREVHLPMLWVTETISIKKSYLLNFLILI